MDHVQQFEQRQRSRALVHIGIVKALTAREGPEAVQAELERRLGRNSPWMPLATKSVIPGATPAGWGAPFADNTLSDAFMARQRPRTVLGRISEAARRVPFRQFVRIVSTGSTAEWSGSGKPIVVDDMAFSRQALDVLKSGVIVVLTTELLKISADDPAVLSLIEQDLITATAKADDLALLSDDAAVPEVMPAGLLNGVTGLSAGLADDAEADVAHLIRTVRNGEGEALFFVTALTVATTLATLRNSDGERVFPNINLRTGGDILGIPLLLSAGAGSRLILLDAAAIAYADGGVEIDRSAQAAIQMLDNPTNSVAGTATNMVSLFQTGSTALRAVRIVNWVKAHSDAVNFIDVSVGSPA